MTEQTPETTDLDNVPADEQSEEKPNFVTRFAVKHPRAAKVIAITGGALAIGGVALTANNVRKNKHHLDAAGDHLHEAVSELSASVSPTDAEA